MAAMPPGPAFAMACGAREAIEAFKPLQPPTFFIPAQTAGRKAAISRKNCSTWLTIVPRSPPIVV